MKALIVLCLMLTACTATTKYGDCVGIDSVDKKPELKYEMNVTNIAIGVLTFELIIPPIYVIAKEFYCPVGVK